MDLPAAASRALIALCVGLGALVTAVPAAAATSTSHAAIVRSAPRSGPTRSPRAGTSDAAQIHITGNLANLTSTPPLTYPAIFAAAKTDYGIACQPGFNNIVFQLTGSGTISDGHQSGPTLTEPVTLGENQAVTIVTSSVQYWLRCLPHDFPAMTLNQTGSTPGYYLTGTLPGPTDGTAPYAVILDQNGAPVWYQSAPGGGALNLQVLPGGVLGWTAADPQAGGGTDPVATVKLYNLNTGATTGVPVPVAPLDFHEYQQTADGGKLLLASPLVTNFPTDSLGSAEAATQGTAVDCVVDKVDASGAVVFEWRASQHVLASEAAISPKLEKVVTINGRSASDVFHCNSVDEDPVSGDLLVSMRHESAVYRVSKVTGNITWKLGGNTTVGRDGEPTLTISDPDGPPSGQHDARFLPNNHVTLFDDKTGTAGPARGVDYAINFVPGGAHSATMSWDYKALDGKSSGATGSFRRYGANDNLVDWGFTQDGGSRFTEVDSATPTPSVLMDVQFRSGERTYRALRAPTTGPGSLDITVLRSSAGMPSSASFQPAAAGRSNAAPTVASWSSGRLDLFVRGNDNALWHRYWDGLAWSAWESLGGVLASAPAAVSWAPDRLDVFARGIDDALWHKYWTGQGWSAWESLGGVLTSAPTAASWGPGRLDVFVRGRDQAVWQKWWDGANWNGFVSQGGIVTSDLGSASTGNGQVQVYGRGNDFAIWAKTWNGQAWIDWQSLGGVLNSGPAATSPGAGAVELFAVGTDGTLWRNRFTGTWSGFLPFGGTTNFAPGVAARSTLDDVFITAPSSAVMEGAQGR